MAVVRTIASALYTPRTINTDFNIPANTRRLKITFTSVGWPTGVVGSVTFTQPDGSPGGSRNFIGGQLGKDGLPMLSQSMQIEFGPNQSLPSGQWGVQIVILQALTTAVTVERF